MKTPGFKINKRLCVQGPASPLQNLAHVFLHVPPIGDRSGGGWGDEDIFHDEDLAS